MCNVRIGYLADHREVLPTLKRWFETEWASYYGEGDRALTPIRPGGPGDALRDLTAYANREGLPVGLVAFSGDVLCGIAALKGESIATHSHLHPWVGALLVHAEHRRRGVGSALVAALEEEAKRRGYRHLYCATSTAIGVLERRDWRLLERVDYDGERVSIYVKTL